jgi:hypothetical protein
MGAPPQFEDFDWAVIATFEHDMHIAVEWRRGETAPTWQQFPRLLKEVKQDFATVSDELRKMDDEIHAMTCAKGDDGTYRHVILLRGTAEAFTQGWPVM